MAGSKGSQHQWTCRGCNGTFNFNQAPLFPCSKSTDGRPPPRNSKAKVRKWQAWWKQAQETVTQEEQEAVELLKDFQWLQEQARMSGSHLQRKTGAFSRNSSC